MTPAELECDTCGEYVPVTGPDVECPICGKEYRGLPLGVGELRGADTARTEKQEQLDGKRLMAALRPQAKVYDTSQPRQSMVTPGLPDWLVFDPELGMFFFEWKREGGKLSEAQREFRSWCERCGVPYHHGTVDDLAAVLGLDV